MVLDVAILSLSVVEVEDDMVAKAVETWDLYCRSRWADFCDDISGWQWKFLVLEPVPFPLLQPGRGKCIRGSQPLSFESPCILLVLLYPLL